MKILIIGVHQPLLRALRRGLKEEGFDVETAQTPQEISEKARLHSYDMIVLDQLPKQDFTELLQLWRDDGITTPAVVLTVPCVHGEELADQSIKRVSLLQKPFSFVDLLTEIASLQFPNRQS